MCVSLRVCIHSLSLVPSRLLARARALSILVSCSLSLLSSCRRQRTHARTRTHSLSFLLSLSLSLPLPLSLSLSLSLSVRAGQKKHQQLRPPEVIKRAKRAARPAASGSFGRTLTPTRRPQAPLRRQCSCRRTRSVGKSKLKGAVVFTLFQPSENGKRAVLAMLATLFLPSKRKWGSAPTLCGVRKHQPETVH